jgi:outer membrane protein OmpA-like peptidoglycan-associated protein
MNLGLKRFLSAGACASFACTWASAAAASMPATPSIPLRTGLTFVSALHYSRDADYESFTTVEAVTQQGATLSVFYVDNGQRREITRIVTTQDHLDAHKRQTAYAPNGGENYPGTTGPDVSVAQLNELKTKGSTQYSVLQAGSVVGMFTMTLESSGTIHRVEASDVPFSVIVNDVPMQLPAVHARGNLNGTLGEKSQELYILDDAAFPLVLEHTEGGDHGRIVKINFSDVSSAHSVESRLATTGRASVYGIYFDFDSAAVRDQSKPALAQITDALTKHPDWKITIEGHTDNLGGDAYNLDLSKRRAEAVKADLVANYHIDASRLTTAGYGSARPKASNDTLEGRAENRRVELVKQ